MNWGLLVSIFLHILLMAIPISIKSVWEFKDVELFFMEEKPTLKEQRSIEKPQRISIKKTIKLKVVKKSKPILMPLWVGEKRNENKIVIETKKNDKDASPKEKLEPISQQALTSISANREQKDVPGEPEKHEFIDRVQSVDEQMEEVTMVSQITPHPLSSIPDRYQESGREVREEKPGTLPQPLASKTDQPANQGSDTEGHKAQISSKQNLLSQNERVFGSGEGPRFLHREMPVYPMIARRFGREGKVVLKLTIDENGDLLDVEVIEKGGYGFTEAAVEAVKKSTFLPAKKDGKPIASRALLPIRFQLERN